MTDETVNEFKHHTKNEFCTNRPLYRQGRELKAVKVYTVNNESQHLLIFNVPKINLRNELKSLCQKYGDIKLLVLRPDYPSEIFTECYHVYYERIQSARICKRLVDNKSFYGEILHVSYAPELESVDDTRKKLIQRRKDITVRLQKNKNDEQIFNNKTENYLDELPSTSTSDIHDTHNEKNIMNYKNVNVINRKKKHPAIPLTAKRMKHLDPNIVWKDIPHEIDPRNTDDSTSSNNLQYGPELPDKINILNNQNEECKADSTDVKSRNKKKDVIKIKKIVFLNK